MAINSTINSVYQSYAVQNGMGNGKADGLTKFTIGSNNEVLFEEANGEKFTARLTDAEIEKLGGTSASNKTEDTKSAAAAQSADKSNSTNKDNRSAAEIQQDIDDKKQQKAETLEMMGAIEKQVEKLAKDVEEKITEAAKAQEAKVTEYEEQVKTAIADNVAAYVAANKTGGKGMTQEQLQQNVASSVGKFAPNLSDVVASMFVANTEMKLIDNHLAKLNNMADIVKGFDREIATANEQLVEAKAAEAAKCCDPIGFSDANGNKFDFVVMDGAFDTTSDFLGADNQWASMQALDTSGDGKVDLTELKSANIGLSMNGSKDLMNADKIGEMFGSDFTIDLGSYDKNGTHDLISGADSDRNGVTDQNLLGTFTVNAGGKALNGYNTLDDQEWLSKTYGLQANVGANGTVTGASGATDDTKAAAQNGEEAVSEELQPHMEFITNYTVKANILRQSLQNQWMLLGANEDYIKVLDDSAGTVAENQASKFYSELEAARKKEDAQAQKADDKANTANGEDDKKKQTKKAA